MSAGAVLFGLPPRKAIEFFQAKGLRQTYHWQEMMREEHAYAFTVAKMMDRDLLATTRQLMERMIADGRTLADFQRELVPHLQRKGWWGKVDQFDPITGDIVNVQLGSPARLETIFRTNMQSAYAVGEWDSIEANKERMPYLMYDAVDDGLTRDEHEAWDGLVYPVDHPFWRIHYPPNDFNCFTPDTVISGDVIGGIRRWYDGKITQILTASGKKLSVTGNHPVLTSNGWVVANKLVVGDNLLAHCTDVKPRSGIIIGDKYSPATAEQIFQSLLSDAFAVSDRAPFYLNRKFDGGESDININVTDSQLVNWFQSGISKSYNKRDLVFTDDIGSTSLKTVSPSFCGRVVFEPVFSNYASNTFSGVSDNFSNSRFRKPFVHVKSEDRLLDIVISGVSSSPGCSTLPFDGIGILFDGLPLDLFGLRSTSDDNALFNKLSADGVSADSGLFTYLLNAYASAVFTDPVVDVCELDFCGHVYDFQTSESLIKAQGLIVHNCRCGVIQMDADDLEDEGLTVSEDFDPPTRPWTNPVTGQTEQVPEGVGPSFAYNPGQERMRALANAYMGKQARDNASIEEVGHLLRAEPVKAAYRQFVTRSLDNSIAAGRTWPVGTLSPGVLTRMDGQSVAYATGMVELTDAVVVESGVSAAQLHRVPDIIGSPDAVYYHSTRGNILYVEHIDDVNALVVTVRTNRKDEHRRRDEVSSVAVISQALINRMVDRGSYVPW